MSNLDLDKIKKINNGQSKTVHYCNSPTPVNNTPVESSCVCSKPSLPQIEPTPNIVENCVKIPHNCSKPQPVVNQTAVELAAIAGVLEKIIKQLQGLKSDTDSLSEFTENITRELTKTAQEETLITSTDNILEKIQDIRLPEDTLDQLAKEETVQSSTERIIEKIGEVSLPEEILNQLAKESTLNESTASISSLFSTSLSKVSKGVEELRDNLSFVQQGVDDIKDNLNLKLDSDHSYNDAQEGEADTIYFTNDTHQIVLNGESYGSDIVAEDVGQEVDVCLTNMYVRPIKDLTEDPLDEYDISPNYKYLFGVRNRLTINLVQLDNISYIQHYFFEFTAGPEFEFLSLPDYIKWVEDLDNIEPGKTYQISIENNLGLVTSWN